MSFIKNIFGGKKQVKKPVQQNINYNNAGLFGSINYQTETGPRFVEDLVKDQKKFDKNSKKNETKYHNLDLSDLFKMSLELSQDKIKLSDKDQSFATKLSIKEDKLAELTKHLTEEEQDQQASLDVFLHNRQIRQYVG